MLSSLFRSKGDQYKQSSDRSPFSSPFSDRNSQAASRRNVLYSRRRVAADFDDDDHGLNSAEEDDEAVEEDEDEGVEDDDQDDEDDGEGKTPLLPIFEASYLGMALDPFHVLMVINFSRRCSPCLQPYSRYTPTDRPSL